MEREDERYLQDDNWEFKSRSVMLQLARACYVTQLEHYKILLSNSYIHFMLDVAFSRVINSREHLAPEIIKWTEFLVSVMELD